MVPSALFRSQVVAQSPIYHIPSHLEETWCELVIHYNHFYLLAIQEFVEVVSAGSSQLAYVGQVPEGLLL